MWKQEKESKGIRCLLETHKQEIKKIKCVTRDLGPKFEELIEVINKVITNYKQIMQTVKEWAGRQQMLNGKVSQLKGTRRKTY